MYSNGVKKSTSFLHNHNKELVLRILLLERFLTYFCITELSDRASHHLPEVSSVSVRVLSDNYVPVNDHRRSSRALSYPSL